MTPKRPSRPADETADRPIAIDTDALFAAMSDAVLVLDRSGRWLGSAPTAISRDETARRRGEWLIGKRMHEVLDKAEAERLVGVIGAALDMGQTQDVEYRVDIWGDERWFAAAVSPMDEDRVVWVARDVTKRVAAQRVLEERVEERTRELSALLEVSRALSSALDLRTLVSTILRQLGSVIDYSGASVSRIEEEWIEVVDSVGPDGREDDLVGARLWLDIESGWWDVVRRGEPVVIDDVQGDGDYAREFRALLKDYVDLPGFSYMRSWMGVPLYVQERVVGMLTISKDVPGYFTQRQLDLVLAVARQAAVAVENARLFEQAGDLAALEERQRLARDLHDSVSQALYGIALGARTARTLLDREPAKAAEPIDYVLLLAEAGLAEMRSLIFELRPESLESEGLVAAIQKHAAAQAARHGIAVSCDLCDEPDISPAVREAVYRIVQEALTNTLKHAKAGNVRVTLKVARKRLRAEVADDGIGFDPDRDYAGHLGLHSMRERAAKLGGQLRIESKRGSGTRVIAEIPTGRNMS